MTQGALVATLQLMGCRLYIFNMEGTWRIKRGVSDREFMSQLHDEEWVITVATRLTYYTEVGWSKFGRGAPPLNEEIVQKLIDACK